MVWHAWHRRVDTPGRSRSLTATRILWFVLSGMLVLGYCLTQGVPAAPFSHAGMGCHDDCWHQRPSWQPVAVLQHAPALPPPQRAPRFVILASSTLTVHDDNGRPRSPRSPPMALPH